jgi:hypothetical protein
MPTTSGYNIMLKEQTMKTPNELINEFMANNKITKVKASVPKDFKVRYTFKKPSVFKVREHL